MKHYTDLHCSSIVKQNRVIAIAKSTVPQV